MCLYACVHPVANVKLILHLFQVHRPPKHRWTSKGVYVDWYSWPAASSALTRPASKEGGGWGACRENPEFDCRVGHHVTNFHLPAPPKRFSAYHLTDAPSTVRFYRRIFCSTNAVNRCGPFVRTLHIVPPVAFDRAVSKKHSGTVYIYLVVTSEVMLEALFYVR